MKKSKLILTGILLLVLTFQVHSQCKNPQRLEQIKTQKVAYYTTKLNLTSAEAEKFWPIFNEMDNKIFEIQCRIREILKQNNTTGTTTTEKEQAALVSEIFSLKKQENDIKNEYENKISALLSPAKTLLYFEADHGFKKELMKHARNRDGKGPRQNNQ